MVTVLVISSPLVVIVVLVRIRSRVGTAVSVMMMARCRVIVIIAARILFGVRVMMTVMTIPITVLNAMSERSRVSTTVTVVVFGMQEFLALLVAGQEWEVECFLLAVFAV